MGRPKGSDEEQEASLSTPESVTELTMGAFRPCIDILAECASTGVITIPDIFCGIERIGKATDEDVYEHIIEGIRTIIGRAATYAYSLGLADGQLLAESAAPGEMATEQI